MRYRPVCGTAPCPRCPFLRKSAPGWLGAATPESFIIEISMEHPLPCHPTINYEDKNWLEKWEAQKTGRICSGSLVMAANMAKRPRDPDFPRRPSDRVSVFATHAEFIAHHSNATVRSWETDESHERRGRRNTSTACACGHSIEEHGHDDEFPSSTACNECGKGDCIAFAASPSEEDGR